MSSSLEEVRDPAQGVIVVRAATDADAGAIAAIYNEGIEDRVATLETRLREPAEMAERIADGQPMLVAERDGVVAGWAAILPYSDRCAYSGVGEYTIYVARAARGQRVGAVLLDALVAHAAAIGRHKLVGKILSTNAASVALARRAGFREVGVHLSHGRLDGAWKDVVVVERVLDEPAP